MQNANGSMDADSDDSSTDESSDSDSGSDDESGSSSSSVSVRQKATWYMQGCLSPNLFFCGVFVLIPKYFGTRVVT